MHILAEIALQILVWLWEIFYLARFFAVLSIVSVIAIIGDVYLPEASAWRQFGTPLVIAGAIAGLIWEIAAWKDGKNRSLI